MGTNSVSGVISTYIVAIALNELLNRVTNITDIITRFHYFQGFKEGFFSDFSNSFILLDEREYYGTEVLRYDFNEYGKAIYVKVLCKNNVGEFSSETYIQKLDDDAQTISKYIYSYVNDFYNDLFGD